MAQDGGRAATQWCPAILGLALRISMINRGGVGVWVVIDMEFGLQKSVQGFKFTFDSLEVFKAVFPLRVFDAVSSDSVFSDHQRSPRFRIFQSR
jgi:hypothetical protein